MTISNQQASVTADGDGLTTQFAYTFLIPAANDVTITVIDTTVVPQASTILTPSQYSITGIDVSAGGMVTYPLAGPALPAGWTITISRTVPIVQTVPIANQGNFYPSAVEGALDYLTMICQDLQQELNVVDDTLANLTATDVTVVTDLTNGVNTVALLRTAVVTIANVNNLVYLKGYYAADDGGEGVFLITNVNPGADNGGTIIWSDTPGFYYVRMTNALSYSVKWFGAKGDGTTDDAAAFTAALAATSEVTVPDGVFALDTSVEVSAGKKLVLSEGTTLLRQSAASATTPVVYVIGIRASLEGGQIVSQKASPSGVVCLGHKSQTDNRNAWWWRFANCTVQGLNTAGSIAINIPSGQATIGPSVANYFGFIQNINTYGGDIGMLFSEYANAHNVSGIQFWNCRTSCLELRGAYANNINGMFMHTGAASGLIAVNISSKTIGTQESTLNTVIGWTAETSGGADVGLVIAASASKNTVIGNDNVAGGFSVSNPDNLVMLRGIIRFCSQANIDTVQLNTMQVIKNTSAGTRDSFDECDNTISALAADSTLTLKSIVKSGMLIIRNATDGGTGIVMVDSTVGVLLINGGGFIVVTDPGSGASKFWVEAAPTYTRITNRYSASKQIDVRVVAAN